MQNICMLIFTAFSSKERAQILTSTRSSAVLSWQFLVISFTPSKEILK